MSTPDPHKLTVREAYERLYDKTDLRKKTIRSDRHYLDYWERFSDNPPVADVSNQTLQSFKAAMLEAEFSPASVNTALRMLRKVFRMLGPQETGNPGGLGIIDRRPYTKPVKHVRKPPKRIPLDDLTKFYVACKHAKSPVKYVPSADWWRALIVVAYFTGLRKGDLLKLKHDQFDLEKQELRFQAQKTGKADVFHLHEIACQHLQRIWNNSGNGRKYVFQGFGKEGCSRLYAEFKRIANHAKISGKIQLQGIRRTTASEIERVAPGLGKVILQHAPKSVTEVSYLNMSEELKEAINAMRIPIGFKFGVKMHERDILKQIAEQRTLRPVDYLAPIKPPAHLWKFEAGRWRFNGSAWFQLGGRLLLILKALAESEVPLRLSKLCKIAWPKSKPTDHSMVTMRSKLSAIRLKVRKCLGLSDEFDPIPCVDRGDNPA